MRKYLVSILVLVAMLSIVGCGGGSSSDKKQGNKGDTEQPDNTGDKQTPTTLPKVDGKAVFTKSYLKGKTLYLASPKDKDVVSFVFDESSFSGEVVYRAASSLSYGITSKGYISFMEPNNGKKAYFKPLSQDKDKISLAFSYDEASLANITKANKYFYFVKEKAVEYIKTVKAGDTTNDKGFKFTKEYLNGKTFYFARKMCISSKDGKCLKTSWELSSISYTENQITMYNVKRPDNKAYIKNYTISKEGHIEFYRERFKKDMAIKPLEKTADFISVIWAPKGSSALNSDKSRGQYLYFDKAKGEAFVKAQNEKTGSFRFTKEYLSGKTLYHVSVVDKSGFQTFIFSQNDFQAKDSSSGQAFSISYSITSEGYMSYQEPDGDKKTAFYKMLKKDDDKISMAFSYDKNKLEQDTGVDKFFYFDKAKAEAFVALKK